MAGLALALTGSWPLAVSGALLAALSKPETALLCPLTFALVTQNLMLTMVVLVAVLGPWLMVRLWAGNKRLYCNRWTWKKNLLALREMWQIEPVYMSSMMLSLVLQAATLVLMLMGRLGATWPVPLLLMGASWTMAMLVETRVIAPLALWIALGVM